MTVKKGLLPPLDYLLAFEAAALRQGFATASRDLNISETAISRKIRLLELHYDVALFLRGHRSVRLTPQGRALLEKTRPALEALRNASREMMSEHRKNTVNLAATNSVAALWLMPRLHRFNSSNKHVRITLFASDNDEECLGETMDLTILRGDGDWPGFRSCLLFGETVFPVCSPGFLSANPGASSLSALPGLALIEVASSHTEWMNWKTWMGYHGSGSAISARSSMFNTYPLAIQAAADGLGVALGWGHLVDPLLESGQLVRPLGNVDVRTSHGYFLLTPEHKSPFPERSIVETWLLQTSAARKRYDPRDQMTRAQPG